MVLVLVAIGLVTVSTVASGELILSPPPVVGTYGISSTSTGLDGLGPVDIAGVGMAAFEPVDLTTVYAGPSGLRFNKALPPVRSVAPVTTVQADGSGHFAATVYRTQFGVATVSATGRTSGHSLTVVLTLGSGVTQPPGTTTIAPLEASGSTSTGGLASTGVSIAGPLTVGAAGLAVGLGTLFFGTRLAIRRKFRNTPRYSA